MECLAVDFPADPIEDVDGPFERNEDEADHRVLLAAAVDLFAGPDDAREGDQVTLVVARHPSRLGTSDS